MPDPPLKIYPEKGKTMIPVSLNFSIVERRHIDKALPSMAAYSSYGRHKQYENNPLMIVPGGFLFGIFVLRALPVEIQQEKGSRPPSSLTTGI